MFVFSLGNSLTSAISPSTAGENLGFVVEEWHTSGNERRVVGVAEEQRAQVSLFDVVVVVDFFLMFSLVVYRHARCVRFLQMRACAVFVPWGPLPMLVGSFPGIRKTATEGAVLRARQEHRLQDVARARTVKLFHYASSLLGVLVYSLIPLSFSRLFSRCISLSLTRTVPRGDGLQRQISQEGENRL